MIARKLVVAALAGVVVLAPTAAVAAEAYPDHEDSLLCSTAQVPVGESFTCTIAGPNGLSAQLQTSFSGGNATIAGVQTSVARSIVDNEASFRVTAPEVTGAIAVTGIVRGEAVDTAVVDVVSTGVASDRTEATGDTLSATGFENAGLAAAAGALLVSGAAAVFAAARRRSSNR